MRKRLALWFASVVAAVVCTSAVMLGQARLLPREHQLLPGEDVGFRIEGTDSSGRPIGTLMVRVDGQWVEVGSAPNVRRLK